MDGNPICSTYKFFCYYWREFKNKFFLLLSIPFVDTLYINHFHLVPDVHVNNLSWQFLTRADFFGLQMRTSNRAPDRKSERRSDMRWEIIAFSARECTNTKVVAVNSLHRSPTVHRDEKGPFEAILSLKESIYFIIQCQGHWEGVLENSEPCRQPARVDVTTTWPCTLHCHRSLALLGFVLVIMTFTEAPDSQLIDTGKN